MKLRDVTVLLEDRLAPWAQAYRNPVEIVCCEKFADLDACLARVSAGLSHGLHAAGLLSYELGYALEPKLQPLLPACSATPLFWFGLFETAEMLDPIMLDAAFAALPPPAPLRNMRGDILRQTHIARLEQVLAYIAAGDIYQANLTFQILFEGADDPLALYAALRAQQPVRYGGYAVLPEAHILSVSPELWVQSCAGRAVTRPMKGTVARGGNASADAQAQLALQNDPKQRAENLMIVDLLRNDLGRIAAPGTVRVESLFDVETYPSFHTLTSTISAQLAPNLDLKQVFSALFPCGSIVGAPKIRAAEIIHALESGPRGVYTGALGSIAPDGDMRFNVAIRTAQISQAGAGRYGVGGGIVFDSRPDDEFAEAMLKADPVLKLGQDFGLIETFRWDFETGFQNSAYHLARLARSANALGFCYESGGVEGQLAALHVQLVAQKHKVRRIRLELSREGACSMTHSALPPVAGAPLRVGVATDRLDQADPYVRHKTTRRAIYERAFQQAQAAGCDEALLLNRRGEVSEASRHNVFVESHCVLLTPPMTAGLLPGVLREMLLGAGRAVERRLSLADLQAAPRWYLGNSLHGLRLAQLVEGGVV